jgi:hypothetical protein
MRICKGNRSTRRKPAPVPLCPPQIPHGLTWAFNPAAAVESRRLTGWAMARPPCVRNLLPPACYVSCIFHSNYIWRRLLVMELLIMQLCPTSYSFIPLGSKFSSQHPVVKRLQFSSTRIQNTGKIIVLYILIITFFDSRREGKRFWAKWWQALPKFNVVLISSWIKFWFIAVVSKYLNFATLLSFNTQNFFCTILPSVPAVA